MAQVVQVKHKYNLAMDQAEAAAAQRAIDACSNFDMIYTDRGAGPPPLNGHGPDCNSNPLGCYDDDNGRITSAEARPMSDLGHSLFSA